MTFSLILTALLAASPAPAATSKTAPPAAAKPAASVPVPAPVAVQPPPPSLKPARPPGRQKIAVMDLKAVQGVSAGTVEILGNVVAADLAREGFDVISKSDIQSMLGFQKDRQLLGCTDDAGCIAEIGGSLGVDFVLTGQIGQIGSQFNISIIVVDTKKAKVVTRLSSFCDSNEDALVKAARGAVVTVATAVRGGALPPPASSEQKPFTRSRTTAWMAWGSAAALLAGGAVVGVVAKGKYDDLEAQKSAPNYFDIYAEKKGGIRRLNLTADALYAGAAVMAGLGTWVWFRVEKAPVAITPMAVNDGAGLQVAGRF